MMQPKLGTDPDTIGYYGVAERDGKPTLLWVERVKRPMERSPGTGTRAAGQWWLPVTYRSMRAAEADLSVRNDTAHYPPCITPPESVDGFAGGRP